LIVYSYDITCFMCYYAKLFLLLMPTRAHYVVGILVG